MPHLGDIPGGWRAKRNVMKKALSKIEALRLSQIEVYLAIAATNASTLSNIGINATCHGRQISWLSIFRCLTLSFRSSALNLYTSESVR